MSGPSTGLSTGHTAGLTAAPPARRWMPLALTLGLHLLLVLAWLGGTRGEARREPPPRVSVFVPVQPLARPQAAPSAPPPTSRRMRRPAISVPAPPPLDIPSITVQAPATAPAETDTSSPSPAPAPAALPGDLLASSKAMAGRVDRDLRKGASPITAEPDRKWERFADAFAAARTGAPRTVTLESYTSPDGVIIYRKTVGDKVACYRSGSVGGLVTGFGPQDGQGAGRTTCPSGVSWTRR